MGGRYCSLSPVVLSPPFFSRYSPTPRFPRFPLTLIPNLIWPRASKARAGSETTSGREGNDERGTVSELDTTAGFVKQSSNDPMARMARVVAVGVPHHVTQRGNNRQDVFLQDEDR
jgi:hypothetical protein